MIRTPLRRRTPLRARRRETSPRVPRPGTLPSLPADWRARCRAVRRRDEGRCRWCAHPVAPSDLGAVDHLIPRRLADERVRDAARNLVLLCQAHHSGPKAEAEAALFAGQSDRWMRFLNVVQLTGPRPTPAEIGAALTRLNALLTEAHDGHRNPSPRGTGPARP